jgi:hypothetical protein
MAETLGGGGAAMGGLDEWGNCVIEKDCAEIERNFVYWKFQELYQHGTVCT